MFVFALKLFLVLATQNELLKRHKFYKPTLPHPDKEIFTHVQDEYSFCQKRYRN